LPESVATWGSREEFQRQRSESGQWVFWEDRADLVLAGRYTDVTPLHVEVSPTYLCNFACPWCSCRSAREEWSEEDVFNHPRATPLTVMRQPRLESVVDHLAEHEVEIMWVGGEPTMNPLLYPAVKRAHARGLNQCIFTNGSLFNEAQAQTLFDSELVFVRVSLNAVTPEIHQRHHDYDPRRPHAERVARNLEMLAELRAQNRSATMLGVSVVVDANNVNDIEPTVRLLADLCERNGSQAVDYLMLRPAFPLTGAQVDVDEATRSSFLEQTAPGSTVRVLTAQAGIDLVMPDASVAEVPPIEPDDLGCLAAGWFGEVTPSGEMLPCSDLYGDPEYFIGNVATHSVSEIWAGKKRREVLSAVSERQCASTRCPANGRGNHLNRVFRAVERCRRAGRTEDVSRWMDDLREVLDRPAHSFFL
jgi:radical SAM protein with 4Fe4S-binding SPASM domain